MAPNSAIAFRLLSNALVERAAEITPSGDFGFHMNDALRDEIVAEINTAFAKVRRGSTTLHEAEVIDNCGSDKERRTARRQDTELCWQDVPAAVIQAHPLVFSFLCSESFRYYIAAYMVWSLRHYRERDLASLDFTIYALAPNTNKPPDRWKLERFSLFSPPQARAVQRFLRFMVEHREGGADSSQAELALNAYWNEAASVR